MPSLLDIAAPQINRRQVDIRGTMVDVQGITGEVWAELYGKFPALKTIVQGGSAEGVDRAQGVIATAAMIAAGTGHHGDTAHVAAAVRLSGEEQQKLLQVIIEISYPGEIFIPLVGGETALLHALSGAPDGRASDTR